MLANPIELNSRLGTYTNFVNLLDLCGLALPASLRTKERRSASRCWRRRAMMRNSQASAAVSMPTPGCRSVHLASRTPQLAPLDSSLRSGESAIAVVGAHLSGMALNDELKALDGRLLKATTTAHDYRLYALRGTAPPKPGLLRVEAGLGVAIEVEVWALTTEAFGAFVAMYRRRCRSARCGLPTAAP